MSIAISTEVQSAERVVASLDMLDNEVRRGMYRAIERTAADVSAIVRSNLSGVVLNVRTGRLLGSLSTEFRQSQASASARVGVGWYVGRFWEKGFRGQQEVQAHRRATRLGSRLEVIRQTRSGRTKVVRTYETGAAEVRAYTRSTDGRARPFLSPALAAVRGAFEARVAQAVEAARSTADAA